MTVYDFVKSPLTETDVLNFNFVKRISKIIKVLERHQKYKHAPERYQYAKCPHFFARKKKNTPHKEI